MTTSPSPLEQALQSIYNKVGWKLYSLSRVPHNSIKPWTCELYPGHFGSYFSGTRSLDQTCWVNSMVVVRADGATALEAVEAAREALDKSDAREVYEDLDRAIEDWYETIQSTRIRR